GRVGPSLRGQRQQSQRTGGPRLRALPGRPPLPAPDRLELLLEVDALPPLPAPDRLELLLEIAGLALGELLPGLIRARGLGHRGRTCQEERQRGADRASAARALGVLRVLLLLRHARPLLAGGPPCRIGAGVI